MSLVAEPDTSCFPLLLSEMSTEESSDQSKVLAQHQVLHVCAFSEKEKKTSALAKAHL